MAAREGRAVELYDVYETLTDEFAGTFCGDCAGRFAAANDHIDLTFVDATEAHCDACGAIAEGYGSWE